MLWRLLSLLSVLVLTIQPACAQSPGKSGSSPIPWVTESGFITGMGTGSTSEGQYRPILLMWRLGSDLKQFINPLENHKGSLSAICEPQINPVIDPRMEVEFGVGLGLQYTYPVTPKISPYIMGTAGPHFITLPNENQANGFVFSSTIGAGLYYNLNQSSAIGIGYRYRHLSNAGLHRPNGGINTHFGTIGYSVFF